MNRLAIRAIDELCSEGVLLTITRVKIPEGVMTGKNHPGFVWSAYFGSVYDTEPAQQDQFGYGWTKSEAILHAAATYRVRERKEKDKFDVW